MAEEMLGRLVVLYELNRVDEKKPAMGSAGWKTQKELDPPYANGCENTVIED
jgi:hypothetical protein